ncbi:MAG TPA: NAD(P)/FAD-dependent oxidoreductase [Terriglobia bacterium]|nr:NAD(P)/FAD-dependent oxidoreductase [Terriglobia bacterium]
MRTIAIVGGGPAGAMTATRLMQGQAPFHNDQAPPRVIIFEEKFGWEKPCGGGLSHKALKEYPFLLQAAGLANPVWKMEVHAPGGVTGCFNLRRPLAIYSRKELNRLLLERSRQAGAEVVGERISGAARWGEKWRLRGRSTSYEADFLIIAAGARSVLRNHLAGALKPRDFMLTFGYFVPGCEDRLRIEFFENFEGYAWSFPRANHLSVGICGKVGHVKMVDLQQRLAGFMARYGYSSNSAPVFSHLLPALEPESWARIRLEGDGWALAGDTAGLTDPLTGEGLYFALRSGELLADSILKGSSYARRVWSEFGKKLMLGARIAPKFYRGEFLGASMTARMVQFCSRSRTFLGLFEDVVEGNQHYLGLPGRVFRNLPRSLVEMATHSVWKRLRAQPAGQP